MVLGSRFLHSIVVSVALGLLASEPAQAGPDSTADRFLNDTVSMMDWGMFRLEQSLDDGVLGPVTVSYDWDRNRIVVQKWEFLDIDMPKELMENSCSRWMSYVRHDGFVDPETGLLRSGVEHSSYASYFGHNGFGRTLGGQDELAALRELDRLFELRYRFYLPDRDPSPDFSCFGDLLSNRVAFESP